MKKILYLSCLLVFFSACRKDIDTTGEMTVEESPFVIIDDYDPDENIITSSVSGLVINENDEPIPGAVIKLRNETYTTDEDGYFFAKDLNLDAEGSFYTVTKDGYFKGSRRFYPKEGNISNTKVQLMLLNNIDQFEASAGATVTGTDGISITFQENGIINADGTPYDGMVSVAAKWLNPSANNVGDLMPGALFGVNSQLEEVSLATYGMMAVELFGANGESLNIADGKTAELSFPIPDDLIASAPSEIPLWSFEDEQFGVWVEEGKAVLEGDRYIGTVSHFSFWNCDAPFPLVFIEGRLVTAEGDPVGDANIIITVTGSGLSRWGYTDSEGYFSGKMPKDEELTLEVGSSFDVCEFESVILGTFSVDTNVGDIALSDSGDAFTVTGSVIDCDGNAVTNGRVRVVIGGKLTTFYLDGVNTFNKVILNCDNETDFTVRVDDLDNLVGSDLVPFTVATPSTDVGTLTACGNVVSEFFTLTVNGESANLNNAFLIMELPITGEYMFLSVFDSTTTGGINQFQLTMDSGLLGTYDETTLQGLDIQTSTPDFSNSWSAFCQGGQGCVDLTAFTLNITKYDGVGGDQEGNLTGTANFTDVDGTVVPNIDFSANWKLPIN